MGTCVTFVPMPWLRIEVDGELHKALKRKALDEDTTLKALIIRLLQQAVGMEKK